jgi:TATA-binding protein-associated factor
VETEKRFDIVKAFNADPTIDVLLLTTHGECRIPTRYWEYNS